MYDYTAADDDEVSFQDGKDNEGCGLLMNEGV